MGVQSRSVNKQERSRGRHAPLIVYCGERFVSNLEISTLGVLYSVILLEIGEGLKGLQPLQCSEVPDGTGCVL